jgi:hypothetical protein
VSHRHLAELDIFKHEVEYNWSHTGREAHVAVTMEMKLQGAEEDLPTAHSGTTRMLGP